MIINEKEYNCLLSQSSDGDADRAIIQSTSESTRRSKDLDTDGEFDVENDDGTTGDPGSAFPGVLDF